MRHAPIYVALLAAATPLAAAPLSPDGGPFKAEGSWTDQAGHLGQWHAEGTVHGGKFDGSLVLEMLGVTRAVMLQPARATVRGGICVLRGANGRNWIELRGPCDAATIGSGTLSGSFDGKRLSGKFQGTLGTGAVPAPAPPAGAPTDTPKPTVS